MRTPIDVTAARFAYGLAEQAAMLERFPALADPNSREWSVSYAGHGVPWCVEWSRLRLTVDTPAGLALARTLVAQRAAGRQGLRETVVLAAVALGLDRWRFLRPAVVRRGPHAADHACLTCPHVASEHNNNGRCGEYAGNSARPCPCPGWQPA